MKFILPFFFFLPIALTAQISIGVADMAQVGDVITRKTDTLTILTGPGGSGANQTWNFSQTSSNIIDEITNVINPADAPNGASFPTANLAMTTDNSNYLYFEQNASQLNTLGFAGDLLGTGNPVVAPLTTGLLVHNFPRTFGSNFSDTYVTDITLDGSAISPAISEIRFKRTGLVLDSTDAYGQLTTPVATYNSLRTKRIEYSTDSIWIKAIFPPTWQLFQVNQDTTLSYQWYANQGKLAVAELTFDTLGVPNRFTWLHASDFNGINEMSTNSNLKLYPNPSNDVINFEFLTSQNDNGSLIITDLSGKIIEKREINPTSLSGRIDVSLYSKGIYFFEYTSTTNQKITQKFIVK